MCGLRWRLVLRGGGGFGTRGLRFFFGFGFGFGFEYARGSIVSMTDLVADGTVWARRADERERG